MKDDVRGWRENELGKKDVADGGGWGGGGSGSVSACRLPIGGVLERRMLTSGRARRCAVSGRSGPRVSCLRVCVGLRGE